MLLLLHPKLQLQAVTIYNTEIMGITKDQRGTVYEYMMLISTGMANS